VNNTVLYSTLPSTLHKHACFFTSETYIALYLDNLTRWS